jgi:hypothetical protein
MSTKGLTIFLPDGDPNSVEIIEVNGWVGKAFIIPRAKLKQVKDRPESNLPALYFLFGENQDETKPSVYIGETEIYYQRLTTHDTTKDFWNLAIVFCGSLDKADVRYLENKAVQEAKTVGRYLMTNGNARNENTVSEFKKSSADSYFETIKFVMAVLGYTLFEPILSKNQSTDDLYYLKVGKTEAKGSLLNTGEFIVFRGSTARKKEAPGLNTKGPSKTRQLLVADGRLKPFNDDCYVFTQDVVFTSPSLACSVITGTSANGWIMWKDGQGRTLDENKRK